MIVPVQDLDPLLHEWQQALRLQDWDVTIRFGRRWEMGPDRAAEVTRINAKKTALIVILDPVDYDPGKIVSQDVERSVVHELVHLYFAGIDSFDPTEDLIYEQAVNAISNSLVDMKRRAQCSAS